MSNQGIYKENKQKVMFERCLEEAGCYKDDKNKEYPDNWTCYTLKKEFGEGHCWVYYYKNLFAIYIVDFTYFKDLYLTESQEKYIAVNYFESIEATVLSSNEKLQSNTIQGHIGEGIFKAIYHKNTPMKVISISIMPEYYIDFLKSKFENNYVNPLKAFESINGNNNYIDIIKILKQLKNYKYKGSYCELFFESKIYELISLIVKKSEEKNEKRIKLISQDRKNIEKITQYINEHYNETISLNTLSDMANMSQTKLKYTFKQIMNCTIHEYQTNTRMIKGETLLLNSTLSIKEISEIVGYKKANNFIENFKKSFDFSPSEYRKSQQDKY